MTLQEEVEALKARGNAAFAVGDAAAAAALYTEVRCARGAAAAAKREAGRADVTRAVPSRAASEGVGSGGRRRCAAARRSASCAATRCHG